MAKIKPTIHKLDFDHPSLSGWTVSEDSDTDLEHICKKLGVEYADLAYWALDSSKKLQYPQQIIRALREGDQLAGWELEVVSNIEV